MPRIISPLILKIIFVSNTGEIIYVFNRVLCVTRDGQILTRLVFVVDVTKGVKRKKSSSVMRLMKNVLQVVFNLSFEETSVGVLVYPFEYFY